MATAARVIRAGLPRVPGGDPWPPRPDASVLTSADTLSEVQAPTAPIPHPEQLANAAPATITLRRGLPRSPGGAPWPPASPAPAVTALVIENPEIIPPVAATDLAPASASAATRTDLSIPLRHAPTVFPGRHAFTHPAPRHPRRFGPFTAAQWVGASLTTGIALLFAVSMVVLLTRWLVSLEPVSAFLTAYPGEYHLPLSAPVGLPAWIGWQHFFNVFLMVLIIRSGLQVRHEKRPPAYWTPRWNRERKISLTLWSHQALDALWLVNGVVFIALLSVSGQWMRIVPTSWEVFPNALSAALQYVSLDWPTENGWVNYNSLQQLAYFTTVFVAAPLAAATGIRMSGLWPTRATRLNRFYPLEAARAVHFPVMLYFVAFIIAHVALVFATGALRNLNHMYASQDADNWAGFWIFSASIALIVAAVVAVRPVTIGPIARWFGTVSSR